MTRRSRQRDLVLEIVRSTMDHPTADWVHRQARRRMPRISLGTVYRNLKQLAGAGRIREIQSSGHSSRFDGNTGHHYHIRCLGCGRVNDLPLSVDTRLEKAAERAMNYRVLGHAVEIHGLCPSCQAAVKNKSNSYLLEASSRARPTRRRRARGAGPLARAQATHDQEER